MIFENKMALSALQKMFDYRLSRLRQSMAKQDVSLAILLNPVSLRYAIDFDEYQLFQAHIPTCYLFVPLEGPLVMHGATRNDFPNVSEYRRPYYLSPFDGGLNLEKNAKLFCSDVKQFTKEYCQNNKIAIERISPEAYNELKSADYDLVDAECILEQAKKIKCSTEIECIKHSIAVAEHGMKLMHQSSVAGVTERQLWSILHKVNIANNGSWIEGHMLSSGPRTNPWLQEATNRTIAKGEMIAFDTDLIGPKGYMADISRSWICEGGKGSAEQRIAYQHAYDEVNFNVDLIKPGMSFFELSKKAYERNNDFKANHYPCVFHGAGLSDEYPKIYYHEDWERDGYDGLIEPNMVLCVESYSGKTDGEVGVKLEEMVLVNESGAERLSHYPFEDSLLN